MELAVLLDCVDVEHFDVLALEGMLGAVEYVQVLDELAAQTVLGEHAFHDAQVQGVHTGLEVLVVRFLHQYLGGELALTAGIAGVGQVFVVSPLFAGQFHLVGVDDDDVVATFHVGRELGFVFATQDFGNLRAKTTEHLVGGIDNHPLALNLRRVEGEGLVA